MERRDFLKGAAVTATGAATLSAVPAYAASPPGRGPWNHPRNVRSGVEVLADNDFALLRGQRVGLISNPTGIFPNLVHEVDIMHDSGEVNIVAGFGPEHGFRGGIQAGGGSDFYVDPRTGIPIYPTYGKSSPEIADIFRETNVDTVAFDIQDVGSRFYTFIWTMYDSMVAAALAGVRFVVLDRPNPISGVEAYGPVVQPGYYSFVGRKPISQQHGMTIGELAELFNGEFIADDAGRQVDLSVATMDRWTRDMYYEHTGLPWVMPSPNMPTVDTATVYPGMCLFEGTNHSEGRGTTRPFEIVGSPYTDYHWRQELASRDLAGTGFRETYFIPTFDEHTGTPCAGVQVYPTDRREFMAIPTAIVMLVTARRLYTNEFEFSSYIDLLTGSDWVRTAIQSGKDADEVVAGWQHELRQFRQVREQYLLYHQTRGGGLTKAS